MTQEQWQSIYETAISWTKEAGESIRKMMDDTYEIHTKVNEHDLVTDVDRETELFFKNKINEKYSTHRIMGEEGLGDVVDDLDGTVWIIDPIDGTVNFVHQKCYFAISIGVFHEGKGMVGIIYDVMADEIFTALNGEGAFLNEEPLPRLENVTMNESLLSFNAGWVMKDRRLEALVNQSRGIRSYGAASLEMAYVACGRIEAYISFNLAPWDMAGGYVLLEEVGGIATNYEGNKLTFLNKDTLLAANPAIYKDIMKEIHGK
ncbi:inositol monophosphatase family protein [Bacillus sp. H-16]|uniref:inositol monophosphatase family protein n=1 Tax=Alteribacter salitolerans TaxID=2912333 RepID=UPI0019659C37|nr:inositol monophosphatase family protein [Alteribacter salitolerans]MBM7095967.1 inositol monophosphatase family protein [Alteribacter salitolerans]